MAYSRHQQKHVESYASEAVGPFDTDILIDRVVLAVEDSHKVQTVVALVETAEAVDTRAFSERTTEKAAAVVEEMSDEVEAVVDEVVAHECGQVIEESNPEWWRQSDVITEEMVDEAVKESIAWLRDHPDAAERADVSFEDSVPEEGELETVHEVTFTSDMRTESH